MELNLFYTFIVLSAVGFLYRRFMDKFDYMTMKKDNKYLKEFLETHYGGEFNSKKPIAWIYLPFERNAMNWPSFHSRNTNDINNTLMREILNKNTSELKDYFNVLIIDNNSFGYLLDNVADLDIIGNPVKDKLVDLYILKLIQNYGGMRVPNHFAIQDPQKVFDLLNQTTRDSILCFKRPFNDSLIYDIQFVGSLFNNNQTIGSLVNLQASLISNDATDESNFKTTSIPHLVCEKIINYDVDASGVSNVDGDIVTIEDFMSMTKPVRMRTGTFMVYLPIEQLSKRTHYNWITYVESSHPTQMSKFLNT